MKAVQTSQDTGSHTLLTGAILFANLDYSGLAGYAIKAAIGGAIWMCFKLAGDYFSQRIANRRKSEKDDHENPTPQD